MISKKNGPAVNYSKVSAIPPKKSLAYVNNFVINTTQFLNRFSYVCENKLREVSSDITRLEIMLSILESKLASIPGLEGITPETVAQIQNDQPQQQQQQPQQVPPEAPAYLFDFTCVFLNIWKLIINISTVISLYPHHHKVIMKMMVQILNHLMNLKNPNNQKMKREEEGMILGMIPDKSGTNKFLEYIKSFTSEISCIQRNECSKAIPEFFPPLFFILTNRCKFIKSKQSCILLCHLFVNHYYN